MLTCFGMPNRLLFQVPIWVLLLFLGSCAQYHPQYHKNASNWASFSQDSSATLRHTVFLMGDAGGSTVDYKPPGLRILSHHVQQAGINSTLVYLGDNIYPNGMAPKKKEVERKADEVAMVGQLEFLKDFPGNLYVIAGNHDWYEYGIDGLKRQRKFIEKYLDRKDIWGPDCGCGDPVEIDLDDNLVLVLLDTEWWLTNWNKHPEINQDCLVKSREVFRLFFEDAIKSNRDKNLIVATHHPLHSHGPHGGSFSWKEHLFPITEASDALWIPLPGLGSAYPLLRSTVGSKQDLAHPRYRDLKNLMINIARKNGRFIFVSGHEHTLQYLQEEEQHFIVSGSGSRNNAVAVGQGTQFAEGAQGFAKLLFYEDGSAWVEFWSSASDKPEGVLSFRRQINGPLSSLTMDDRTEAEFVLPQDSILTNIGAPGLFERKSFGRWLWGNHYRDAYLQPIKAPLLNLDTFRTGVFPVKRGGGYQTNSLRLEAASGRQYAMRSLDKDPTRMVAYPISESKIVLDIIKDSFSGAHPLAALPIPMMADAVRVYHTRPELFYVPQQPALVNFNPRFGDALYLVEERPDDDHWQDEAFFGKPDELMSTQNMLDEIKDDHDHILDWDWILRSRLFDIVIGDWDRHDDQWRWAQIESGKRTIYRPVPRDRDQAFGEYDGFLFSIARNTFPAARPLRKYKPFQQGIKWSNYGSRYFDASFLSGSEWKDWEREIRFIQTHLTDSIIQTAFQSAWPTEFMKLDGDKIVNTAQKRRDNLLRMGASFYKHLAKKVDVIGTDQKDLFLIERLDKDSIRIRVYDTNSKGEKEELFYDRTFSRKETKEVRMYGLADDDIFQWEGTVSKSILTRAIGGEGKDEFDDDSKVKGLVRKTKIYDSPKEDNDFDDIKEARVFLRKDPRFNTYNRLSKDYEKDHWFFLPSLGFNPDDGILIGLAAQRIKYGFKKAPYASSNFFGGLYSIKTNGFQFNYKGEFIDAIGDWAFGVEAQVQSPLYATNFYGYGNGSEDFEDELGNDFHLVRKQSFRLAPILKKYRNSASSFSFGPTLEGVEIQRTEDRILDSLLNIYAPEIFDGQLFLGGQVLFEYNNTLGASFPEKSFGLLLDLGWKAQINTQEQQHFPYVKSNMRFLLPLDNARRFTFGTRVGGEYNFTGRFYFFQAAQLGGTGPEANFRGLRRNRYIGRGSFYQNLDLRWKTVTSDNKSFPFTMGMFVGFDYGRVWGASDDATVVFESEQWHNAYGGGIFLNPLDLLTIQLTAFRADNDPFRFILSGKFFF